MPFSLSRQDTRENFIPIKLQVQHYCPGTTLAGGVWSYIYFNWRGGRYAS